MSKNKTDFTKMYIYVDTHDSTWFAGDIHEDKKDAFENWINNYGEMETPNGFFLEVLVPAVTAIVQSKFEDIPVYTI